MAIPTAAKPLLRSQLAEAWQELDRSGLSRTEFDDDIAPSQATAYLDVSRVSYRPAPEYFFLFDLDEAGHHAYFTPGRETYDEHRTTRDWVRQLEAFRDWARYLTRELGVGSAGDSQLKSTDGQRRLEQAEELLGMLAARATGGHPSDVEYRAIRADLLEDEVIRQYVPPVLKSHRSIDDFWGFIKVKFEKYDDRRQYLRDQFAPLFEKLEGTPAPLEGASSPVHPATATSQAELEAKRPSTVFVVHGHDTAAKEAVARLLEGLGIRPIILHEQPNMGRTIIEKFEANSDVDFAIVVMTPDDEGKQIGAGAISSRSRQNVVLELGYFIGRLGRRRVAALVAEGVEQPSDVHGLVYIGLDRGGGWRLSIAKELQAAGFDIDFSRL